MSSNRIEVVIFKKDTWEQHNKYNFKLKYIRISSFFVVSNMPCLIVFVTLEVMDDGCRYCTVTIAILIPSCDVI